ncbi:hypothetical protein MWH25_12510 [Natroniella acetigena]|uniref:hypothetical protein n=1 Tax=Natroniella acetigena TaxID=52004 RepID=UPI00200AFE70|nr:hypothetical protein [Natroniella acetigena]MCK8828546.1 hypothetical protein [Natroniella acetigena]
MVLSDCVSTTIPFVFGIGQPQTSSQILNRSGFFLFGPSLCQSWQLAALDIVADVGQIY